jgi:hypothetical protein
MKKLFALFLVILLFHFPTFSQSLKKGNLLGLHVASLHLRPGVTLEQFQDFYIKTIIPEFERNFSGVKVYFIKAIRGENENSVGLIYFFESERIRDAYFDDGGIDSVYTVLGKAAHEKGKTVGDQLKKYVESSSTKHTDWVIQ